MKHSNLFLILAVLVALLVSPQLQASSIDVATAGSWIGTYGEDGYILPYYLGSGAAYPATTATDLISLPSFVTGYSYQGPGPAAYKWQPGTPSWNGWFARSADDPRPGTTTRETCIVYDTDSMTVNLTLAADAPDFQMAVYAYHITGDDYNETVATQWQGEATPFDSATLDAFQTGKWAVFDVSPNGKTQLDIILTKAMGSASGEAMVQGIMFTAVPEPGTFALLCCGLVSLALVRRRKK